LPLTSIVSVYSTRLGNKGYVAFESPAGRYAIIFRRFKDDPERIKEIVMRIKPKMS